jgi:AcrR family transcriptional regulator
MTGDTRERILKVASELFIDQGFEATSLRQISERLGFTKAALYYHFRSKDEIFAALVEPTQEMFGGMLDRLEAAEGLAGWADALDWAITQIFTHLEFFKLVDRNRNVVEAMGAPMNDLKEHVQMHDRIEAAAKAKATSLHEHVRMIAALGAVTGFDDWAPELLTAGNATELQAELSAAVRDVLRLPRTRRARLVADTA